MGGNGFMVWRRLVLLCVPATIALLSLISTSSNDQSTKVGGSQLSDFGKNSELESDSYPFDEEPQLRGKRGTVGRGKKIWNVYPSEGGAYYTVPYALGSVYTDAEVEQILTAMRSIEKRTCLRFERIDPAEWVTRPKPNSYVSIVNHRGRGCHSGIGRHRGRNLMRLEVRESSTCVLHHIILHELLHLLGLYHEHQRPDRDKHIHIHRENIESSRRHNYDPKESAETHGLPYDFDSIMHYAPTTFGRTSLSNGREKLVIEAKNRKHQSRMGAARHASSLDYLKVNLLYNCEGAMDMMARARARWELATNEEKAESVIDGMPSTIDAGGLSRAGSDRTEEEVEWQTRGKEFENLRLSSFLPALENPLVPTLKRGIVMTPDAIPMRLGSSSEKHLAYCKEKLSGGGSDRDGRPKRLAGSGKWKKRGWSRRLKRRMRGSKRHASRKKKGRRRSNRKRKKGGKWRRQKELGSRGPKTKRLPLAEMRDNETE